MINHVRTLLLNKDGSKRPAADFFYEELVPADYREQTLGAFGMVRDALFGGKPDNAFLNFRLHQIMKVIHSTEYVRYVTAPDSRITYDTSEHLIMEPEAEYSVNPLTGTALSTDLTFLGSATTPGETILQHRWLIDIPYVGTARLTNQITGDETETAFTFTSGLSDIIEFPGTSNLSFRFTRDPAVNARWAVSVRKKPSAEIYAVLGTLESLGEEMNSILFSKVEPYSTFEQIWLHHPWWTYRLTGVALALAYRTEAILNG